MDWSLDAQAVREPFAPPYGRRLESRSDPALIPSKFRLSRSRLSWNTAAAEEPGRRTGTGSCQVSSSNIPRGWQSKMPSQAKAKPTLAQTIQQAVTFHRQGRLGEAERLYRAALAKEPRQFEGLHFLGLLKLQQGRAREALELLRAAAEAKPDAADVLPSLGAALAQLGRCEDALGVYGRILRANPIDVDAHYNRGVVLSRLERHDEALESYDKVLGIRPD